MKSVLLGVLVFFTFCNNIKAQLYEIELTGHIRTNGRPHLTVEDTSSKLF